MQSEKNIKGYLYAFITVLIWSGWMIMSKIGINGGLKPFDMVFIRFVVSGLIMSPIAWKNRHLVTKDNWRGVLLMVLGAGAPYLLATSFGFKLAPAGHGLLTPCSMTVFVAILSYIVLKERITRIRFFGYLFIIGGVAFRFYITPRGSSGLIEADLFFLSAGMLWAIYTIQNKRLKFSAFTATSFVATGSALLLLIPYSIYQFMEPHKLPILISIEQIIYQGILTGIVSLITYNKAMELIGAARAASFAALIPVLLTLLAIPLLGEYPTANDLLFVFMMALGVFLASGVLRLKSATMS